jgi:hypothetical protein
MSRSKKPDISPGDRWKIPMRNMILAAAAVFSLATGSAFAQGYPLSLPDTSRPFSEHRNETFHFLGQDTVVGRLFNHSNSERPVADKAAASSTKG